MSGTLTPLRSDSGPPTTTSVSSASARLRATRSRSLPSSSSSVEPMAAASMISGCGRLTRPRVARRRVQVQAEGLAGLQMHAPAAERADAQLRALHVGQDADRAVELFLQLADHGEAGGVVVVRAVREIQPEHVGAGLEQAGQHLGRGAGGAERGNDLGAPAAAQLGAEGHQASPPGDGT